METNALISKKIANLKAKPKDKATRNNRNPTSISEANQIDELIEKATNSTQNNPADATGQVIMETNDEVTNATFYVDGCEVCYTAVPHIS